MSGDVPGSQSQSDRARDLSWLAGLGVSLAALAVAVWGLDVRAFAESLERADYMLLIPAFVLQLAGIAARAQGWRVLLGSAVISYRRAFAALTEGYLLNNILPLRLGELARAYLVGHNTPIGASRALGAIVVERMVDVSIAAITVLVTIPFLAPPAWAARSALGAAAGLALLAGGLALALRQRATVSRRLRQAGLGPMRRLADVFDRFVLGLDQARSGARLLPALAWLVLGWTIAWVQFGFYLRMFGQAYSLRTAWFGLGVIALGGAVPSSPGGIGVYELAGVAALRFLGLPQEVALGVVLAGHAVQFTLTVVLGSLALSTEGRSLRDLARAARGLLARPSG